MISTTLMVFGVLCILTPYLFFRQYGDDPEHAIASAFSNLPFHVIQMIIFMNKSGYIFLGAGAALLAGGK